MSICLCLCAHAHVCTYLCMVPTGPRDNLLYSVTNRAKNMFEFLDKLGVLSVDGLLTSFLLPHSWTGQ